MRLTKRGQRVLVGVAGLTSILVGVTLPINHPGPLPRCEVAPVAGVACWDITEDGHYFTLDTDGNLTFGDPTQQREYLASITNADADPGLDGPQDDSASCWTVAQCDALASIASNDESEPLGPEEDGQ